MALADLGDDVHLSYRWLSAHRDELRLTEGSLEWGMWSIAYEDIEDAMIYRYPCYLGSACTLLVRSRLRSYHFQLPSSSRFWFVLDPFWLGPLPFPLRYEFRNNRSFLRRNIRTLAIVCILSAILDILLCWIALMAIG
jgi:hypothetical protein